MTFLEFVARLLNLGPDGQSLVELKSARDDLVGGIRLAIFGCTKLYKLEDATNKREWKEHRQLDALSLG